MEKLNDLVFLLPDYELEGFPRSLNDDQAARVLSGWVALWHPVLMCGAGKIPRWHQATRLPSELASTLFVLPPISREAIDSGAAAEIAAAGGLLLEPCESWQQFQSDILSNFPQLEINASANELASEYAALAYTYLQIQLMTRQLRYTSNLDVALFEEQVLKSTEAVMAGDTEQARVGLQACFDTLGQERDHYYSNDANLLDITLLAETTLGKSLRRQLDGTAHSTFIASADLLRMMQTKAPENFQSLQARLSAGTACLAGGLDKERLLPVEGRESAAHSLYRGQAAYRALNVPQPTVFARTSFGLNTDSVTLLSRFGFQGALLIPFTGGSYPTSAQPKISWESHDGTRLPAIACQPLDAASTSSFLALGWTLGEALDRQHVPTIVFAHWPGRTSEYFELLQIACSRTPALGRFVLADRYFAETTSPYHHERLEADKFNFNWLAEAEDAGAVIAATKYSQKIQCRLRSLRNLANLIWQLDNRRQKAEWRSDESGATVAPSYGTIPTADWAPRLAQATEDAGALVEQSGAGELYQSLKQQLTALSKEYMQQLAPLLVKKQASVGGADLSAQPRPSCCSIRVLIRFVLLCAHQPASNSMPKKAGTLPLARPVKIA